MPKTFDPSFYFNSPRSLHFSRCISNHRNQHSLSLQTSIVPLANMGFTDLLTDAGLTGTYTSPIICACAPR